MRTKLQLLLGLGVLVAGAHTSALAQGASVLELFQKHNLLGTFAWDCAKPVGKDNYYYVHRQLDTQRVQRDMMSGPQAREFVVIWEQGRQQGPDRIALVGNRDGQPVESTYLIEPNRVRVVESTAAGKQEILGGRFVGGRETPWMYRCKGG
jgi:hypothetical protein